VPPCVAVSSSCRRSRPSKARSRFCTKPHLVLISLLDFFFLQSLTTGMRKQIRVEALSYGYQEVCTQRSNCCCYYFFFYLITDSGLHRPVITISSNPLMQHSIFHLIFQFCLVLINLLSRFLCKQILVSIQIISHLT
jgi:hypothetical protein